MVTAPSQRETTAGTSHVVVVQQSSNLRPGAEEAFTPLLPPEMSRFVSLTYSARLMSTTKHVLFLANLAFNWQAPGKRAHGSLLKA